MPLSARIPAGVVDGLQGSEYSNFRLSGSAERNVKRRKGGQVANSGQEAFGIHLQESIKIRFSSVNKVFDVPIENLERLSQGVWLLLI
jgi:hypothetical protein